VVSGADAKSGVVVLWGESDHLLRLAAAEAFGGVRATEIDAVDWQPGATADLATPSLFGEPRALLVSNSQHLREEALVEVASYAEAPSPDATLIVAAIVSSRAKGPPAALARALKGKAAVRRVAVDRKDLPSWVRSRASDRGMKSDAAAASTLVQTVGEDPAVLDQALAQIQSAYPAEGLTSQTVAAQFRGFGDRRIWELCDAAFGRNLPTATRCLAGILESREEPLAVLGGISSRLRDLLRVRSLPDRMPPAELARAAELRFEWQARRYREQARRFTPEELADIHARLVDADRALKLGAAGDVVLPMLVAKIARG
jgi:DNA polymerase III subunit delta